MQHYSCYKFAGKKTQGHFKVFEMELQEENANQSQDKIPSTSKELHCNYCPRRFTKGIELVQHVSIIHRELFGKKIGKNENLDLIHCNYCGEKFTGHKNYAKHVSVVHHDIRPFSCDSCKKAFASKQELVRHSEKSCRKYEKFGCKMCDQKFSSVDNVKNHYTTIHPKEPIFHVRPLPNFTQLIVLAMMNKADGQCSCLDIYKFVSDNFPYYDMKGNREGWKNSVRSRLSMGNIFEKKEMDSTGGRPRW